MSISDDLRQAVLQAAIQGKLTKQLPEDGNAKDLLEQIKAEKAKLIKEGKLKKEKPLPEITEDEKPFDIPDNWEWCRISETTIINPKNDLDNDLSTAFIPMACVVDGFSNNHTFEIRKWGDIKKGFSHFANGDIGVAKITPCFQNRKSVVFRDLKSGYGAGTTELIIVRTIGNLVLSEYLLWFFKSENFISDGMKSFTGTAGQQRIHKDYLPNCAIPLPPLSEQKRIVAKVEELMAKIDDLEKPEKELEALKKAFPADMKASLLQVAMQGKLTEQLPEDGSAKDLLEQIKAEKAKLVKEGKLKKEKPLPEITEDEKPFDIPENWEWVRLGNATYNHGQKKPDKIFCYIDVGSIDNKRCCLGTENNVVEPKDASSRARKIIKYNDVIYATIRPYLHNISLVNREFPFEMVASTAFAVMACCNGLNNKFLYYALLSPMFDEYVNDSSNTKGVAYPAIGEKTFFEGVVPLPPLAEQKRIVEKLEKLLPLCDGLE